MVTPKVKWYWHPGMYKVPCHTDMKRKLFIAKSHMTKSMDMHITSPKDDDKKQAKLVLRTKQGLNGTKDPQFTRI